MIQRCIHVLLVAAGLALAACSDESTTEAPRASGAGAAAAALTAGAQAGPRRVLADSVAVDPEDAANQLFDFAEVYYPDYFPGHPASATALGYFYRYYAATGIYLGVKEGQVYVLGGTFGGEVRAVGALTAFIAPQPRVLSSLCAGAAPWTSFATPDPAVGKNAAVTLAACSGEIRSVQWRQTAGPAVPLPADRTQTISFDPPAPGAYAFEASFTDASGAAHSESVALSVGAADAAAAQVTLRASQSVRMGGKVSLRAWPTLPEGDSVKAVTWTQIDGPAVQLDTTTPQLVLFTAPAVSRDSVIRLRATLYTAQGRRVSDEALVLVERYVQAAADNAAAMWGGDHVSRSYAYKADGPYAAALRRCVYDAAIYYSGPRYSLCTLDTLPFLAQDSGGAIPSVEQVMNRVLVSHDWLGRNFEAFLRAHDERGDVRRMLNSVTAIVLSTQIRPSFYHPVSGAIYLDADSFWMTAEERDTINEAPDYRSDFGSELHYATLWRYVKGNQHLWRHYDPAQRLVRTLEEVRDESTWMLFHELSHAADFTPPSAYGSLQRNLTAWANIYQRYGSYQLTSDTVPAAYPLTSNVMAGLGQVQFQGVTATALEKSYTSLQVAAAFSADLATDDYNYSTSREDIAMTQEEFLMQRRQGIRRDFAIIDPIGATMTAADIVVRWGQRGRIGEETIKPRTRAIVQALAPWADANEVDLLPPPILMRPGESWAANLEQPLALRRAQALGAVPSVSEMWRLQQDRRRMLHHRDGPGKRLPPGARH